MEEKIYNFKFTKDEIIHLQCGLLEMLQKHKELKGNNDNILAQMSLEKSISKTKNILEHIRIITRYQDSRDL